ncbi:hypothetical protein GCM10020254_81140 [Streptomyces goshikiensis]
MPSWARTMPVVRGKPRAGVWTPPSAGSGRVARIRTLPPRETAAIWRALARVTYAVPSGARVMFSGVWPLARSKCTAVRAHLSGAETADAGAAVVIATAAEARAAADTAALESLVNTGILYCFRACGSDTPTHEGGGWRDARPATCTRGYGPTGGRGGVGKSAGAEPTVRTGRGGTGDGLGEEIQGGSRG